MCHTISILSQVQGTLEESEIPLPQSNIWRQNAQRNAPPPEISGIAMSLRFAASKAGFAALCCDVAESRKKWSCSVSLPVAPCLRAPSKPPVSAPGVRNVVDPGAIVPQRECGSRGEPGKCLVVRHSSAPRQ